MILQILMILCLQLVDIYRLVEDELDVRSVAFEFLRGKVLVPSVVFFFFLVGAPSLGA